MQTFGCKGGETLRGITFKGIIQNGNGGGLPVSDVVITVDETGESDRSDADGNFEIGSSTFSEDQSLSFIREGVSGKLLFSSIADTTEKIELVLSFNQVTGEVSILSAKSFPVDGQLRTPTPIPTSAPLPPVGPGTPAPRPTDEESNEGPFDSDGNTTSFGIPRGITGNIRRGNRIWSGTCQSCHLRQKRGSSYGKIRRALSTIPQMEPLSLSSQQIADVTAYLNR